MDGGRLNVLANIYIAGVFVFFLLLLRAEKDFKRPGKEE